MKLTFKNRPIEVIGNLEVNEGFYIKWAGYLDGDKEDLTDAEYDDLQENHMMALYDLAYENLCDAAEFAHDAMVGK